MLVKFLSILGVVVDGETINSFGFVVTGKRVELSDEITLPRFGSVKVKIDTHLPESIEIDQTGFAFTKAELQNFAKEMECAGWHHIANSRTGEGPTEPLI